MYDKEFEKYFEADIEFPQMELPEESELDEAKFKKGDIVIPNIGPHKGEKHTIIHDFKNGSYNISLNKKHSRYDQGAAKAKENQLKLVKEEVELDEGSSDTQDMYALMVKGMKAVPGSSKQKDIIKQINVIRKKMGMPLMKEAAELEMEAKSATGYELYHKTF